MLFNSISFLAFFTLLVIIYFTIPHKYRLWLLIGASIYFYYSFIPIYLLLVLYVIVVNYLSGIFIDRGQGKVRKLLLTLSIILNLSVLFYFKYFNFFVNSLDGFAKLIHWNYSLATLAIILPIGISFFTFQGLGYVIDVYRGTIKPEKNFFVFSLFKLYFPQLIAGPIERAKNLIPQFGIEQKFDYKRVTDGLKLMVWGLFKKVVIADRLVSVVNVVYGNPQVYAGSPTILATFFFAFQIYCDFSGYSDMAIGMSQVLGIKIMDNFNRPYSAKSIPEFWRRWHISLSTWFRDYVYYPLGGNKRGIMRMYLAIVIVFLVSGLWHGANWTFVVWGGLHAVYMISSISTQNIRNKFYSKIKLDKYPKVHKIMKLLIVFMLVGISWIFFRASTISNAWFMLTHLFTNLNFNVFAMNLKVSKANLILSFFFIFVMEAVHFVQSHQGIRSQFLVKLPVYVRWVIYLFLILSILLFGVFGEVYFIYFQF